MRSILLDGSEKDEYAKFAALHFVNCLSNISITYSDAGIGTHLEVACLRCGEKKDITDYSS